MHALTNALKIINAFFANIVPIGDILWTFPQNFSWYANIPIIGSIPFAIYLLLGMGIYFSIRTKFVQFRYFKRGIQVLTKKKKDTTGVSPLAAFMLSAAMRVGPGNIIGVTGAISLGGPGAMFWMWISALLGMASSFVEATLAQIFKEKDGDEYVGGLPYYGQKLAGNKKGVGIALAILFIIYAMLSIPIQTFHVFTAAGTAIASVTGVSTDRTSPLYYALAIILIIGIAIAVFGGIKRVTAVTDRMVPVMAVLYATVIVGLFIANIHLFPAFIQAVVIGAFKPDAIFGGAFGTVLAQGIKRGLLSNEAGQGTITMSAAAADAKHPCEQGILASLGVFLDTIVICTLTALVILCSGVPVGYGEAAGAELTILGFTSTYGNWVSIFTAVAMCCFAFSTIIGWGLYGTRCVEFLLGTKANKPFMVLYALVAIVGATMELGLMWNIAETFNGLMAIPNLIAVFLLSGVVVKLVKEYFAGEGKES